MKNWEDDDDDEYCSTREDLIDAAAVADVVGIDLEAVNFSAEYKDRVFAAFLAEYEGRPHAESGRAVQRGDQVQGVPRPCDAARRRAHRDRALRAHPPRRRRPRRVAEGARRNQGPELLPASIDAGATREGDVSAGRDEKDRRARTGRADRAAECAKEGLDRHLLHRRAALPRVPQSLSADEAWPDPDARRDGRRTRRRHAHGPRVLHARSAQGNRHRAA